MSNNEPILAVKDLQKSFGVNSVLSNVSFDVQKGEVVSIIGPSGAGKSTLLRCINLLEIADKTDWTVLSTGGVLKKGALSLTGSSAEKMISSYHVDTAICSCKGLDMMLGVTDSNENDSIIKQAMLGSAERRILALDSEKFDKKSFVKVCDLVDIDIIATDGEPSDKWINFCSENGIDLVC